MAQFWVSCPPRRVAFLSDLPRFSIGGTGMNKLFSSLQVGVCTLCWMAAGVATAEHGDECQPCHEASSKCAGDENTAGCMTCQNIWDGYCESRRTCIRPPRKFDKMKLRRLFHFKSRCPGGTVGVYGVAGPACCAPTPRARPLLKQKLHKPMLTLPCTDVPCDTAFVKAVDTPRDDGRDKGAPAEPKATVDFTYPEVTPADRSDIIPPATATVPPLPMNSLERPRSPSDNILNASAFNWLNRKPWFNY